MQKLSTEYQQTNFRTYKKNNTPRPSWSYLRNVRLFQYSKAISVTHLPDSLKKKNHTSISIDSEKEFDKIQYPFLKKTLSK